MRSIELTFDGETDDAVRADWNALADAGLPSLASHTGATNRPHLTLAAGDDLARPPVSGNPAPGALPETDPAVGGLMRVLPLPLRTTGLVVFGAPPRGLVLARLVAVTRELLDLHSAVHRAAPDALAQTLPGSWTPHVTLALRLTPDQLAAALPLLGPPLEGSAVAARLWDSGPKAVIAL